MFGSVFDPEGWKPLFYALGDEPNHFPINMCRCQIPDGAERRLPMIPVNTAAPDKADIDVIEAHTTWMWFASREGFRLAWRMAWLIINQNGRFGAATPAGYLTEIIDPTIIVEPSQHYMAEAA